MQKNNRLTLILCALLTSFGALAGIMPDKVIYGNDHRLEVFEASPLHQKLARSAVTMVPRNNIKPQYNGTVNLEQTSLSSWMQSQSNAKFCSDEKFVDQPNPGMCSGFLIAPDLIITAGHCVQVFDFCTEYEWVFDFKVNKNSLTAGEAISERDIYSCKKIISNALNMELGLDYAIVQLDRQVEGREPLEIRTKGKIQDNDGIVVIGNPSGLPLKVAAGANVRDNTHPSYFIANLDTFQGNSGSAVFNASTGVVEGILVRGEEDYVLDGERMCITANKCKDDSCRGEDVSRLDSIPEIAFLELLHKASASGDAESLEGILKLDLWVDMYGKDRMSALLKAAQSNQADVMKLLIDHQADVTLTDINGDSALHHLARVMKEDSEEVVELLLQVGADLELLNKKGQTPLEVAAKARNKIGKKILIKMGANKKELPWWFRF
jgi:hypothetical protein